MLREMSAAKAEGMPIRHPSNWGMVKFDHQGVDGHDGTFERAYLTNRRAAARFAERRRAELCGIGPATHDEPEVDD